jgi:L-alanine-DL-glutamate epimerase-like enolase superfamily enzyme
VDGRIARVDAFGYELTYGHGEYVMSGGRVIRRLPSTLVRITTTKGLFGWGEVCPLGTTYLPGHAEGARAAIKELAPAVLGLDPTNLARITERMDMTLRGHAYAKSPIDIACWDILGQTCGQPVTTLLGGRHQERFPLYVAVPLGPPAEMAEYVGQRRAEGVHRFQVKIGGDPGEDVERVRAVMDSTSNEDLVVADANGGWGLRDALAAVRMLEPLPRLVLEQPCRSLEECRSVRAITDLPMVLDEVVDDLPSLLAALEIGGVAAINLKISKAGGITHARILRDASEKLGISLTIEDTWGGDVTTAAVSHLAASTRAEHLFTVSFMNDWTQEHVAGYQPRSQHGFGAAPLGPGLGISVDEELLGPPLFTVT